MTGTQTYVTRGGLKLEGALEAWKIDVTGRIACDLGSHVGGFVDCLLARGAGRVYSVDTSYGTLAWTLRNDPRVVVMERTNAMHVQLPEPVDVVTADLGWTRQRSFVRHALGLLAADGVLISLLKPQYESNPGERDRGVVSDDRVEEVVRRTMDGLADVGCAADVLMESPLRGGAGNREYFLLWRTGK